MADASFFTPYAVGGATRPDSFTKLNPLMQSRLMAMLMAAREELGPDALRITSAYRSPELQAQLYQNALKKYGSPEVARKWVAPAGRSQHNFGTAVDFANLQGQLLRDPNSPEAKWLKANAARFGLAVPLSNEPWQVELEGARAGNVGQGQQIRLSTKDATMTPAAGTDVVDQMKKSPGGVKGVLDFASQVNPETGLSRFEQFAAALDPLILPEMRAGQAIRATGAQRVKTAKTNKTIEWLKKNGYAEIAAALEINPEGAANVMSSILSQKTKADTSGDTSMVLTGSEVMKLVPGVKLNPDAPYTVKRKGGKIVDIDAVSGLQPDLTPFQEEAQKGDVKDLREIRNVGQAAQRNQAQVQLLGSLLEQTDTGIAAGLASRANALGLGDFRGDAAAAAEAIISQLVPAQRPAGAGTISDADLALYKASLPSIAASPGGNKLIIQSMLALLEHDIKVGQIAQQALDQTISPAEAYNQMASLPNPFASVRPFFGAKTKTQPTTREDALKVLEEEGVLN